LFQIKESYEGINRSAAISSDDVESNRIGTKMHKINKKMREMDSSSPPNQN
jgi:hypothetical protein